MAEKQTIDLAEDALWLLLRVEDTPQGRRTKSMASPALMQLPPAQHVLVVHEMVRSMLVGCSKFIQAGLTAAEVEKAVAELGTLPLNG